MGSGSRNPFRHSGAISGPLRGNGVYCIAAMTWVHALSVWTRAMQKMHSRYAKIIVAPVRGYAMLVVEGEKPHIASTNQGPDFSNRSRKRWKDGQSKLCCKNVTLYFWDIPKSSWLSFRVGNRGKIVLDYTKGYKMAHNSSWLYFRIENLSFRIVKESLGYLIWIVLQKCHCCIKVTVA